MTAPSGVAGVSAVADRAFALPASRGGFAAVTASNTGLFGELGARIYQASRLQVAAALYGHEAWAGGAPVWGARLEARW